MCGAAGQGPTSASPLRTLWGTATFAGSKLLTPVPPSNAGKAQREMFSNTADSGGGFPGKWQHGPDVSQGN